MKFPSHHIYVLPNDETPVAEFDATVVDLDVIINTALHIGDQFQHKVTFATNVIVVDANTGEVLWDYRESVADGWHTNEEGDECDDICDLCPYGDECTEAHLSEPSFNEDMGFDPYLGCYTDDC